MMMVTQFEFVLCLATNSPVVISIPHEGFYQGDLEPYFYPRKHGVRGREQYLCAIASDANRKIPVASIVRGLLPRSLCDYNRPIHAAPKNRAVADKKLVTFYESYHTCVWELLDQAARRYGKCYHLDLHGFDPERSGLAYDLVLGSHNGRTTLREIDEKALYFFKNAGYKTKLAKIGEKFSGGYSITQWMDRGINALQLEISSRFRKMDSTHEGKKFAQDLRKFILSLH